MSFEPRRDEPVAQLSCQRRRDPIPKGVPRVREILTMPAGRAVAAANGRYGSFVLRHRWVGWLATVPAGVYLWVAVGHWKAAGVLTIGLGLRLRAWLLRPRDA